MSDDIEVKSRWLGEDELEKICEAVLKESEPTQEELDQVIGFFDTAAFRQSLLDLVMKGYVALRWDEERDDVEMRAVVPVDEWDIGETDETG